MFDDYDLAEIAACIDWMPFFNAWEFGGTFPAILDDPDKGEAARALFEDAQAMLKRIIDERWLTARGVFGIFPAATVDDDDLEVEGLRLCHLRQQRNRKGDGVYSSLADFIAPQDSGVADWIGAFAVSAGFGAHERILQFKAELDDYSAIMLEALADRLAEAFAERLHQRVRTEFWGYAPDEALTNEQLIQEAYRGIRPAPGYPACPDHTEKLKLWELLDVEARTGITLTESLAMLPGASVSGWYFSHPDARYLQVGKIGRDQLDDYAVRKGMPVADLERWLQHIL